MSGQGNGHRRSHDSTKKIWGKHSLYPGEWKERIDENIEQEPDAQSRRCR